MSRSLASQIQDVLPKTLDTYYNLILTVGPARAGKTAALAELAAKHKWPRVNVSLSLAEQLLGLTHRQRAVRAAGILDDIISISAQNSEVVLLDNIELLFATELAQDPLKLLQSLSRNRAIVAAWPGDFEGATLTYAVPGHPEARRYPAPQAVIVRAGAGEQQDVRAVRRETK
ncbi:BREX-3 system P-loop-containing protein BrxF [Mesorhizobium sp. L103C131B0]|uniref:BREX-3 system P-loop-containing protein BrxF n=1 Tax=Mesorhizobium sp. L103C131B0 TaxID=1287089 RepID=UPI0003CFEED3|nr:BREX-3 system P-loop-containing protein BrxF [Mesorhizobium sp. L103C131B0]ESZ65719.1 ATPase AAA [Mesorhizobium sp. L103C131B0]